MKAIWVALGLVICATTLHATILVNEALVNEPGSQVTLEWIELYNDSSEAVSIDNFTLNVNGTTINLFGYGFLDSRAYLIICRNLVESGGSPGYESVWGNNSGLWGDTPEESALRIAEESFTLPNASGVIQLYAGFTLVSELGWTDLGGDGYSWERVSSSDPSILNSSDPTGSTPGKTNSVSPVAIDLDIGAVWTSNIIGGDSLNIELYNRGTDSAKAQSILLYRQQQLDSTDSHDTVLATLIPPIGPGRRDTLTFTLEEPGIYQPIGILLSADNRPSNNLAYVRVTGLQYPPIILTEFLPDPATPLSTEWIEVRSVSDSTINLANWQVGDELSLHAIALAITPIFPGERIVVARDTLAFRDFYPGVTARLFQPSSWPGFNNSGDLIRLVDTYGFVADFHSYDSGFGGNYTYSRDESIQPDGPWMKSAESGGTPGELNRVWTQPTGEHTSLTITPKIFSPDGDGIDDETEFALTVVNADAYTFKIYDRTGNLVRTFLDSEPISEGVITWDGRSDAGNRLPIGIYICYFEAEGIESIKETVVIAR